MTMTAMLTLKQSAARLSERERRELSAYLIRLGQERPAWRRSIARRLDEMASGNEITAEQLRRQLGHAGRD